MEYSLKEKYDRIALKLPSNKSVACGQAEELSELPLPIRHIGAEVNVSLAKKKFWQRIHRCRKKIIKGKRTIA